MQRLIILTTFCFLILPKLLFAELADSPHDFVPFLVTACPYEAQDYLDSGDDIVEPVAMPAAVIAFVQEYVDRHHVDEPFHKRKRKRWSEQGAGVGRRSSRPQDHSEPSDG